MGRTRRLCDGLLHPARAARPVFPKDEQLTVLSGTFILHMGDSLDAPAHDLEAGAYHFLPGKMHHAAEARGETVLEVHGVGPFDIHYLDPADDPSKASASSK